ncbi:MAG: DUF169 domain-containing protein [Deltaproteobacteria bacterium]
MVSLREIEEVMFAYIRHQTHPLAVKLLRPGDDVPQGAKNPVRDFGVPFSLCQAFALGRKEGLTIVLDKNSQSCPIALAGLGLVKPEGFLNGRFVLAPINQSTEARKKMAGSLPRFPFGRYQAVLISPIKTAEFDPDVIVFYGSAVQVMRMIQAAVFSSGKALTSTATGSGGCLVPIVAAVLEGECKYAVPGNGDRRLGLVADGELSFGMPRERFEEVAQGLKLSHEGKQTYPISPGYLKLEYQFPPSYGALRKALLESSK